jgi:hypothetical protein
MPFTIRSYCRFAAQFAVTYNAGAFLTLPLPYWWSRGLLGREKRAAHARGEQHD